MDFFSRPLNVDWMGKAKYWVALSALLLLVGWVTVYRQGGLPYGIDFRGGTVITARFAQPPPIDQIRQGLSQRGLGDSQIQSIGGGGANELLIVIGQQGDQDEALDRGKNLILEVLRETVGGAATAGKADFNSADAASLAELLTVRDPLALGVTAGARYTQLAEAIVGFRDTQRGGLLTNFDDLAQVEGVTPAVVGTLREGTSLGAFTVRNVEIVGPRVGAQLRRQAVLATLYALAGMLVYIAFRFEWVYGAAAVLAVFHDVAITLGLFSLFGHEMTLTEIAALLTLVGYSMNDKIVIFDRIRENLRTMRREPMGVIANKSINQTFSRTILTGGLTFVSLAILFSVGGDVLRGFAFILVVGILIGTYSSFGIAAPVVVAWDRWKSKRYSRAAVNPATRARPEQKEETQPVASAGRR
jgi:preprotein translocase subunit SecF